MKYIITEDQLERIKDDILTIPFSHFRNDWDLLQKFLNKRGNPPYILKGNLNLTNRKYEDVSSLGSLIEITGYVELPHVPIMSLGNLTHVGDFLNIYDTPIENLGNLIHVGDSLDISQSAVEDLSNLTYVGKNLICHDIYLENLGKLKYVGGFLDLGGTPISKKYNKEEIRSMVEVAGDIYL